MKMFWELPMGNCSDEEMLDKMRIRELVETDRYCRDYSHFEKEAECWHDDGTVFATWFKGPIKEFLANSARPGKAPSSHKIDNVMVWLKGKRAIAECICTIDYRLTMDDELLDLQVLTRLHFRVEKRDGRWGLVYFEGIYEKDRMFPVFGDSTWFIPREKLQEFRPINWNQTYRLARGVDAFGKGIENAQDWAGPDKPETIRRLYEDSSRWIGMED